MVRQKPAKLPGVMGISWVARRMRQSLEFLDQLLVVVRVEELYEAGFPLALGSWRDLLLSSASTRFNEKPEAQTSSGSVIGLDLRDAVPIKGIDSDFVLVGVLEARGQTVEQL